MADRKNVLLGVTGSIAAYKAADIANQLTKRELRNQIPISRCIRVIRNSRFYE